MRITTFQSYASAITLADELPAEFKRLVETGASLDTAVRAAAAWKEEKRITAGAAHKKRKNPPNPFAADISPRRMRVMAVLVDAALDADQKADQIGKVLIEGVLARYTQKVAAMAPQDVIAFAENVLIAQDAIANKVACGAKDKHLRYVV